MGYIHLSVDQSLNNQILSPNILVESDRTQEGSVIVHSDQVLQEVGLAIHLVLDPNIASNSEMLDGMQCGQIKCWIDGRGEDGLLKQTIQVASVDRPMNVQIGRRYEIVQDQ